jgi:hypothetical protein
MAASSARERVGMAALFRDDAVCGRLGIEETAMTMYTVGLKLGTRTKAVTIEAEDALLAALKMKLESPEAFITYVRKANRRGDRRHPHEALRSRKAG